MRKAAGAGLWWGIAVGVAAGCGDAPRAADVASDATHETVTSETAAGDSIDSVDDVETAAETSSDATPDATPETESDTLGDVTDGADGGPETAVTCGETQACNALLLEDGRCAGTCFEVPDGFACRGTVYQSLCYWVAPTPSPTREVDFGIFVVTPLQYPTDAVVGGTYRLELRLTNATDAALELPFKWKQPGTWQIDNASWADVTAFTLEPRGSVLLTADLQALSATTLMGGLDLIVTLVFADQAYNPTAVVHYPDSDPACGNEHFPASYCPDAENCTQIHEFYNQGRCCDGVFYPGAACCQDADCIGGACVDGHCLVDAPELGSANNMALGNQRAVLVFIDSHPEWSEAPCQDRFADVARDPETGIGTVDFAAIQDFYDDLGVRRFGKATMQLRWTVLGGIATSDFLTEGTNDWTNYSTRLDAWLADRGCPILGQYDKVIVAGNTANLMGFGGLYFDRGQIAIMGPENPYLVAHELAHSFGATDLYLDLAGRFQFAGDLMSSYFATPPLPGDGVMWGELGFADVDRNGVVDIAEFAAFPETLELVAATATLTTKGTLEVHWEFGGREDGRVKRLVVPQFRVSLPDFPASPVIDTQLPWRDKRAIWDGTQLDLAAVANAGQVRVHVASEYRFTARDWTWTTRTLDTTVTLPVVHQAAP